MNEILRPRLTKYYQGHVPGGVDVCGEGGALTRQHNSSARCGSDVVINVFRGLRTRPTYCGLWSTHGRDNSHA